MNKDNTLIIHSINAFTSLNAATPDTNLTINANIGYLTGNGFNYYDNKPALVKNTNFGNYEIIDMNPFKVKYTINPGKKWSDGTPINAIDLLLSHVLSSSKYSKDAGLGDPASGDVAPVFNSLGYGGYYDDHVVGMPEISADRLSLILTYDAFFVDWEINAPSLSPVHALVLLGEDKVGLQNMQTNIDAKNKFLDYFFTKNTEKLKKIGNIWSNNYNINTINNTTNKLLLVSNGGFLVKESVADTHIILERNFNYNSGPTFLDNSILYIKYVYDTDTDVMNKLKTGDIDIYTAAPTADIRNQLLQIPVINVTDFVNNPCYEHVDLRISSVIPGETYNGPFAGYTQKAKDLRRAFLLAYPRQQIIDNLIKPINNGPLINSVYTDVEDDLYNDVVQNNKSDFYTKGTQADRTAQALEIVKKYYPSAGPNNSVLTINLLWGQPNNARRKSQADLVIAELKKIGITVISPGVSGWSGNLDSNLYDAAFFAWCPTSITQTGNNANYITNGSNNFIGYSNSRIDEISAILTYSLDKNQLKELYAEAERIIFYEDAITLPIFNHPTLYAVNKRASNVTPGSLSPDIVWNYWEFRLNYTENPQDSWGLVGPALIDWNTDDIVLNKLKVDNDNIYYIQNQLFDSDGTKTFKIRKNKSWNINRGGYGFSNFGTIDNNNWYSQEVQQDGKDMTPPVGNDKKYTFVFDEKNNNVYMAIGDIEVTPELVKELRKLIVNNYWGIKGEAVSNTNDADIILNKLVVDSSFNAVYYKQNVSFIKNKTFKLRYNSNDLSNRGGEMFGTILSNNQTWIKTLVKQDGPQLKISDDNETGVYTILYDELFDTVYMTEEDVVINNDNIIALLKELRSTTIWGLIGSALNGWISNDVAMTPYSYKDQVIYYKSNQFFDSDFTDNTDKGQFKIRKNFSWDINFGSYKFGKPELVDEVNWYSQIAIRNGPNMMPPEGSDKYYTIIYDEPVSKFYMAAGDIAITDKLIEDLRNTKFATIVTLSGDALETIVALIEIPVDTNDNVYVINNLPFGMGLFHINKNGENIGTEVLYDSRTVEGNIWFFQDTITNGKNIQMPLGYNNNYSVIYDEKYNKLYMAEGDVSITIDLIKNIRKSVDIKNNSIFEKSYGYLNISSGLNDINYMKYVNIGFNYIDNNNTIQKNPQFGSYKVISHSPFKVKYTIKDNLVWSDNTPITIHDLLLTHITNSTEYSNSAGLGNGTTQNPYKIISAGNYGSLYDNSIVSNPLILDDHNMVLTFNKELSETELIDLIVVFPVHTLVLLADGVHQLQNKKTNLTAKNNFYKYYSTKNTNKLIQIANQLNGCYIYRNNMIYCITNEWGFYVPSIDQISPLHLVNNGNYLLADIKFYNYFKLSKNYNYNSGPVFYEDIDKIKFLPFGTEKLLLDALEKKNIDDIIL